jgi:hypothetical protein
MVQYGYPVIGNTAAGVTDGCRGIGDNYNENFIKMSSLVKIGAVLF